jgi:hypothetical protein
LFFASKETGDPVYRNFALQNSEFVYAGFLQVNASELKENAGDGGVVQTYGVSGIHGFSLLFLETGVLKFQQLAHQLADHFIRVHGLGENNIDFEPKVGNREMDLITQATLAIALFDLGNSDRGNYREISANAFHQIMEKLTSPEMENHPNLSFQLFYYLFEYEKRLQLTGNKNEIAVKS